MGYIKTETFAEAFNGEQGFVENYTGSAYNTIIPIDEKYLALTYHLLFAKYEDTQIASLNVVNFGNKVNAVIFQYAPSWIKELEIQKSVRALTEDDIRTGSIAKFTHGYNPSTVPGTANSDTEIETVNEQTLNKYTKSKLDGYNELLSLLVEDVTERYIGKFKKLFLTVIDMDDVLEAIAQAQEE